jgi:hypothetical protein
MAFSLMQLYYASEFVGQYIHLTQWHVPFKVKDEKTGQWKPGGVSGAGNFALCREWDLALQGQKELKNDRGEFEKIAGLWAITQKGVDFVQNKISIQSAVYWFNRKNLGFDEVSDYVFISDIKGKHFDYWEMFDREHQPLPSPADDPPEGKPQ